jgi:hypothetical protein
MESKNRISVQIEALEGRQMLSVTPAAGQEFGAFAKAATVALKAAGSSLGEVCSAEVPGDCAVETIAFLQPPGKR